LVSEDALSLKDLVKIGRASQMVKNLPASARDAGDEGLIYRLGRSPGRGNGNPLQYPCLKNSVDRGTLWL